MLDGPTMYKDIVFKNTDAPMKMDTFDVNSIEDASSSPGPGGTRRAGNLWTAEARDDMYRRRENGESWEDICKDYPRRSRHAMQQQYSMMKKQKAIANGTWTTNRRGRKRRNPMPESWPSKTKRPGWDGGDIEEDATEEDDFGELESEDVEDPEESESHGGYRDDPGANGRPPGLARSVTDPVKVSKPQPRMVSFTPQPSQTALGPGSNGATPPSMPQSSSYAAASQYNGTAASRKRRRLSQDMGVPTQLAPINPIPNSSFVPATVMLEREDVILLLERGSERARIANAALNAEREAERSTFESAISRANRRTSEAQDRLSMAAYEHGDNMKLARAEFSQTLKLKAREHAEAMERLRKQLNSQQETQSALVESLSRQNEHLKNENEAFREGRPEREKELEKENEDLNTELRGLKEQLEALELEAKEKAAKESAGQASSEQPRRTSLSSNEVSLKIQALQNASDAATTEFSSFSEKISELSQGVEELPHKVIVKAVQDLMEQRAQLENRFTESRQQLEQLKTALSSIQNDSKDGASGVDTIMQEAPRTPPADQPLPSKSEAKAETNGVNAYPHLPSAKASLPDSGK